MYYQHWSCESLKPSGSGHILMKLLLCSLEQFLTCHSFYIKCTWKLQSVPTGIPSSVPEVVQPSLNKVEFPLAPKQFISLDFFHEHAQIGGRHLSRILESTHGITPSTNPN